MIDMVYLWCDGNEEEFKNRKNNFLRFDDSPKNNEAVGESRFFDNEELKYSLRSLEKYASWINHVYIVTDRQIPDWLNLKYEKVSIIDHSKIMPKETIPCFNSAIIEYFLSFIPNLSEQFLYGNDDMFFGAKCDPKDFFAGDKPIVRVKAMKKDDLFKYAGVFNETCYSYYRTVLNSLELLNAHYGKDQFYALHHNIDAYTKTAFSNTFKKFEAELKKCFNNKFRKANDLQRILFNLDAVYSGRAILKIVNDPKPWRKRLHFIKKVNWDSYCDADNEKKTQKQILEFKPKLFCLNSSDDCSFASKTKTKNFMETLFPTKSRFEI